jgi:proline iminopeptidase
VDQRGCGRSSPLGEIGGNTTGELALDLEKIRAHLGVDRWLVFGGSWGATLALTYAQTYPVAVSGLVLRGTFLARTRDLEWFFGDGGAARVFPDAASRFIDRIPVGERSDPVVAYYRRVHGSDKSEALYFARAWASWCDRVATWNLPAVGDKKVREDDPRRFLAKVRIETHYAVNRYFLAGQPLLEGMKRLPDVPVSIVHGRRDLTCPLESAWSLHKAIPGSRLIIVSGSGHLAVESGMIDALIGETDGLRYRLT